MSIDPDTTSETVGQRLRRLRVERGLSQREVAGPTMTGAYVSRIELGERRPSVRAVRTFAKKLGVSPTYLETGSEIARSEERELRLAAAELRLRFEGEESSEELKAILAEATAYGDTAAALRARIALGLEAAGRGDQTESIAHLEQAIDSDFITAASRPDVYAALGESYALAGQPESATQLFSSALADLERLSPDDYAARVRFSTYLSYALTDVGDLERASDVVDQALVYAQEETDPYMRIRLYWSLGRIAHEQGKPLAALDHFRHAVALLETTEDSFHLARAYLSCAFAMFGSNQHLDETAQLIEKGERLLGPHPEPRDRAVVCRLKAMHAIRQSEWDEAERQAREAHSLTRELPNQHGLANWVLAEALAGKNDPEAAEAFQKASDLLEQHGTLRERVDLLVSHAQYLQNTGRAPDARKLRARAKTLTEAADNYVGHKLIHPGLLELGHEASEPTMRNRLSE